MKKIYRLLAFLAVCLFSFSCIQDQQLDIQPDDAATENEISFVLSDLDTRAGNIRSTGAVSGISLPLYTSEEDGLSFTLDEEITDMEIFGSNEPETRGIPAFTSNVAKLYGSFTAVVPESATEAEKSGVSFVYNSETNKWKYSTENDLWGGDDTKELDFYMWMPEASATVVDIKSTTNGEIIFDYTSPNAAVDQKDILFTSKKIKKPERTGQHLTFYHALTGVRFRIGNPSVGPDGNKIETKIKSVKFDNLKSKGTCTVDPTATPIVSWSGLGTPASFEQEFGNPITVSKDIFETDDKKDNNLNAADGSLTFFLIPQNVSEVDLIITFTINDREVTSVLSLGNTTWTAGQLRTYTINAKDVDVYVEDAINSGVKENVTITNTGNTSVFIRATIIGNWCDNENNAAVFGYTDYTNSSLPYVEIPSWTIEGALNGDEFAGAFVDLPGVNADDATIKWERKSDGYFYYTKPVAPGETTAAPLFTSYTPSETPPPYQIAGKDIKVHFVMEIATQAIEAKEGVDYEAAWAATQN